MKKMISSLIFVIIVIEFCGCVKMPNSVKLYDEYTNLVIETVKAHNLEVYKDQELIKYQIEDTVAYCSNIHSSNLNLYRCFAGDGEILTKGMEPFSGKWVALETPIRIKKILKR